MFQSIFLVRLFIQGDDKIKIFLIKKQEKNKFPYKIKYGDGRKISVPSQHNFPQAFIRTHGCSLAAMYMALRFVGHKKSMSKCLKYMQNHFNLDGHAKYSLKQVAQAINQISGNHADYYAGASKQRIKDALKSGHMVLFEEKDPIHTAVLLYDGKKVKRFSNGKYKNVTLIQQMKKRCGDDYYRGVVIVKE